MLRDRRDSSAVFTRGRWVEHLHDNIESLKIKLSDKDIEKLESVVPFTPGFPNNFVGDGMS